MFNLGKVLMANCCFSDMDSKGYVKSRVVCDRCDGYLPCYLDSDGSYFICLYCKSVLKDTFVRRSNHPRRCIQMKGSLSSVLLYFRCLPLMHRLIVTTNIT